MIQAYILIELKNGKIVKYVRDVVNDSLGVNKQYYKYRGPAYQELGLTHAYSYKNSGLAIDTTYDFSLNIDGGGATTYSIKTYALPDYSLSVTNKGAIVPFSSLITLLNSATLTDGAKWYITENGNIRCESTSTSSGTSIALSAGSTKDLFASIDNFSSLESASAGDQFADQSAAGKVKYDFEALVTNAQSSEDTFLTFPEASSSIYLHRPNFEESGQGNGEIITSVVIDAIADIRVIEKTVW